MTKSDNILKDEEELINELKNRLKNELPMSLYDDDRTLHNFLKARNFNIDQAEAMLRKNLDFRKSLQLDTILMDYRPPEVLKKYMSQCELGFDKEGSLIRYCPVGNLDGKGIFTCANSTDVLWMCIQEIQADVEKLKLRSKKTGVHNSKCVYIYNLEHMTLSKATHKKSVEYYLQGVNFFQDNFPELLKSVYIINASLYFTMIFALVQKIISGALLEKIHVYGQDGWKDVLLKTIDADVLPAFLGGNRTDPDGNPNCNTFVGHGGMIPEKYYIKIDPSEILQIPGAAVTTVPARSDFKIPVYVDNPKSILKWKFHCIKPDINFALLYMESKTSKPVDLMPLFRIETNAEPHQAMYRCDKSGIYVFVFDNSYSWFSSKQIFYVINILTSKECDY